MAIIDPVVTWWNRDNTVNVTTWEIGTVEAGSADVSATETGFLIWNNKGNNVDVARTMTECTITTKSADVGQEGTFESIVVKERWVEAICDSMGESFETTQDVEIGAIYDDLEGKWVSKEHPIKATGSGAGTQEILGGLNDGSKSDPNAQNNFSEITTRIRVPHSAPAGNMAFLLRVVYSYT